MRGRGVSGTGGPRAGETPTAAGPAVRFVFKLEKAGARLVGQVPPAGRHAGQADRAGVDRPRAAAGRLLHEAPGRGLAARHARGGPARVDGRQLRRRCSSTRGPIRARRVRRDVRRGGGGVPALRGAGPRLQALDDPRLPQRDQRPPAAGVRRDGARGHHRARDRALARGHVQRPPAARALEQDQEQPARADARDLPARGEALRARREPARQRRSLPRAQQRRHPGVLARGGLEPGARRRVRDRRGDLPDRRVHRPAPRRAARAPLARHRLRRLDDPGPRELRRRAS